MANHRWRPRIAAAACVAGITVLTTSFVDTAGQFGAWSAPVNLGDGVNSAFEEFLPELSKNGRSLYFASNRPGPFGGEDLWVSRHVSPNEPWGPAENVGAAVNGPFNERSPALSRDGHLLFFASNRPGGMGGFDIWVSWRAHTHDDFGWQPPVNLGSGVNSTAGDFGASYFENDDVGIPTLFFASSRPGIGGIDIYRSELTASWLLRTGDADRRAEHAAERLPAHDSFRWPRGDLRFEPSSTTGWSGSARSVGLDAQLAFGPVVKAPAPGRRGQRPLQRLVAGSVIGRFDVGAHVRPSGRLWRQRSVPDIARPTLGCTESRDKNTWNHAIRYPGVEGPPPGGIDGKAIVVLRVAGVADCRVHDWHD